MNSEQSKVVGDRKRCALVGAYPQSVASFRGDLIAAIVRQGLAVTAMSAEADSSTRQLIEATGAQFRAYPISRNSMNPRSDWETYRSLKECFRELRPDLILAYTIKPVIWGGFAARTTPNARFFALITGLGYAFQGTGLKRKLLKSITTHLYRSSLWHAKGVVFQNPDNRDLFVRRQIVPMNKCHVVNGSGINVSTFIPSSFPSGPTRFLLIARLLREKGLREYFQASLLVKQRFPDVTFSLLGPCDPSPDGVPMPEVQSWHEQGVVEYLGQTTDVRPYIENSHVYVLPSYHEGIPRTVLEAMAMGRPILTTDASGCKETVVDGLNGWMVPKADASKLAERMIWFIENRDRWNEMGIESRRIAQEKFDVKSVNAEMLRIMEIGPNLHPLSVRT